MPSTPAAPEVAVSAPSDYRIPKNRELVQSMSSVAAQVHDAAGWHDTSLNELGIAAAQESLALGEPVATSVLSGEPGYYYRDVEICLALSACELSCMLRHNLEPEEYFKLREAYGLFHHIGPDYYDVDSGRALAPVFTAADRDSFVAQCLDGRAEPDAIDDFVERWHAGPPTPVSLRRFLGMRRDEYARWMKDANVLYEILFYRLRHGISLPPSAG